MLFRKTVETFSNQNEAEIHQEYEQKHQETEHVQAILQNKIQLLQEVGKDLEAPLLQSMMSFIIIPMWIRTLCNITNR